MKKGIVADYSDRQRDRKRIEHKNTHKTLTKHSQRNMTMRPMKPSEMDLSKISFSELKTLKNGGKQVYVNYDNHGVFIQTPELEIPFDSGKFFPNDKNESSGKYAVEVSLKGHDKDGSVKDFHDMLVKVEESILKAGKENSMAWFKKNKSMEVLQDSYTNMVKVSKDRDTGEPDGKYPPRFTFKIKQFDGEVQCKCFKHGEREPMNVNDPKGENYVLLGIPIPYDQRLSIKHQGVFKKGTKVKMVLRCNGIWITNGKFGCTWAAEQLRIKMPESYDDYSFLDDTDDEGAGESSEKLDANFRVESSDEEDEEDDE